MRVEIDSLEGFRQRTHSHGLADAVVQGLDLREESAILCSGPCAGAVFLGCELEDATARHVLATGGLIFPRLPDLPYRTYRPDLYTVDELMAGYRRGDPASHRHCLDQRIYAHFDHHRRRPGPVPVLEALAQRLHDHAIDDALDDLLHCRNGEDPRRVVAIMGGHSMRRTDPDYRKVALIGQRLAASDPRILMASGGGPGAMEACLLGAWLADGGEAAIDRALRTLARAPSYADDGWLDSALEVRDAHPSSSDALGIPTWFYGHEPPNLFATHIAKYFSNSLREDGLLAIARYGVVFAPGSAGTIQEIFQDAAQNHYGTFGDVSPMVFLGRQYWTEEKPVYPLLEDLAAGRQYGELIAISDEVDEVVELITGHPPVAYRG
ncbi:MAG: hypothetical protein GY719_10185 [bacterium]|nr:hypothetical protein [bacterium]